MQGVGVEVNALLKTRFLRLQWGKVLKNSDRLCKFESLQDLWSLTYKFGGSGHGGVWLRHCYADFADFASFPDNVSRFT